MNSFNPYVAGTSCILKGGGKADHRMTELNALIASAKARSQGQNAVNPSSTKRVPENGVSAPARSANGNHSSSRRRVYFGVFLNSR